MLANEHCFYSAAALLILIVLVLSAAACVAHYKIHPGAVNLTDSTAYDALLAAQTAIDQARLDLKTGELPDKAKELLNLLIRTYNLARDSWLTYRGAIATNVPPQTYLDQLNKNLSDLVQAIYALKE